MSEKETTKAAEKEEERPLKQRRAHFAEERLTEPFELTGPYQFYRDDEGKGFHIVHTGEDRTLCNRERPNPGVLLGTLGIGSKPACDECVKAYESAPKR